MNTLVVPPAAQRDADAVQVLSAWVAERRLHCTLKIGMWKDSGFSETRAWGTVLADVVRHIGSALHEDSGADRAATVDAVVRALLEELGEPTSPMQGSFHPGVN